MSLLSTSVSLKIASVSLNYLRLLAVNLYSGAPSGAT